MGWKSMVLMAVLTAAPIAAVAQPAADPSGDWITNLQMGAVSLRAALHLGASASSFDSPDQGAPGIPANMTRDGSHVVVTDPDALKLIGDWVVEVTAPRWGAQSPSSCTAR